MSTLPVRLLFNLLESNPDVIEDAFSCMVSDVNSGSRYSNRPERWFNTNRLQDLLDFLVL